MKWIWVRHGETDGNKAGRYLGHTDVPLNDKGRLQAAQAAALLQNEAISRIVASDLSRTMETGRVIGRSHSIQPEPCAALRELDFGSWDLFTYSELMERDATRLQAWYDDPFANAPPGGETLRQLGERFDQWLLAQLSEQAQDCTVVCVTHGGIIRWFQCRWLHHDERQFWHMPGIACGEYLVTQWDGQEWKII